MEADDRLAMSATPAGELQPHRAAEAEADRANPAASDLPAGRSAARPGRRGPVSGRGRRTAAEQAESPPPGRRRAGRRRADRRRAPHIPSPPAVGPPDRVRAEPERLGKHQHAGRRPCLVSSWSRWLTMCSPSALYSMVSVRMPVSVAFRFANSPIPGWLGAALGCSLTIYRTLKGHTSSMGRDLHPTARDRRPSSELDPMENVPDVAPSRHPGRAERRAAVVARRASRHPRSRQLSLSLSPSRPTRRRPVECQDVPFPTAPRGYGAQERSRDETARGARKAHVP